MNPIQKVGRTFKRLLRNPAPKLERKLAAKVQYIREAKSALKALNRKVEAQEAEIRRLEALVPKALTEFRGFCLLPPPELRMHVGTNTYAGNFWNQGASSSRRVIDIFGEDPGGLVLDWGCGSGRTLNWLHGRGTWAQNYRGCDVDGEAIDWLRQQGMDCVEKCGALPPLPYPDNHFVGLFCFSVLGHIHPDHHRAWYLEIHRVLRPGGRAYITLESDAVIFGRKSFTEEEKQFYRERGWCYSERDGHYKHAGVTSEGFSRDAVKDLFAVESYRRSGYHHWLDDMIITKPAQPGGVGPS